MVISIDDVINEQLALLDIPETERDMTIEAMAGRLEADGRLSDPSAYVREVLKREEEGGGTGSDDLHITLLAKLARRLVHESFRNRLLEAGTPAGAREVIREEVTL